MKKIFIVLTFIFISLVSFADNTNVGVRIPLGEQKVELDNNLKFLLGLTKVENSTKYKKFINYVEENLDKKGVAKYSAAINLKKGAMEVFSENGTLLDEEKLPDEFMTMVSLPLNFEEGKEKEKVKKMLKEAYENPTYVTISKNNGKPKIHMERTMGPAEEKIKIGITLLPYYSFVANIVKDRAEVIPIVKAEGFDSHTYQPKVEDIERASKVDAIVVNGVGHDEFVYKIIDAVDKKDKPVIINANKDVSLMPVAGTLGNEKIMDSHTFISITAAIQQVHNITKELIKLDPKNKDFYLANSREYVKKLRKLKTDALKEVQDVNGTDVRVATFLGGYNYLLSEFGIDVKAVLEPTHGSQISMSSLQKMIEKIKKEKIDIIFGEKNYSDEYVSIIKNETGIEVRKLEHLTTGAYRADSFEKFIKVDLDEVVSAIKYVKNKNKNRTKK